MKVLKPAIVFVGVLFALLAHCGAARAPLHIPRKLYYTNEYPIGSFSDRFMDTFQKRANDPVMSTFQFLEDTVNAFRWTKLEEVIVVLGDTGLEKTLLTLLLANEKLNIKKTSSGQFQINGRLGALDEKPSFIPKLITDKKSILDYYILPDWSLADDAKHEISIFYHTRRVLQFARRVKFVFTIDYQAVKGAAQPTAAQKCKITEFLTTATKLIKNLDKYRDAIGLVVLNVENNPNSSDTVLLNNIAAKFLKMRTEFTTQPKVTQFINILMQKERGSFSKLALLRSANATGDVNGIPWMQSARQTIAFLVHANLQYVQRANADFGYALSSESRNLCVKLIQIVKEYLSTWISEVSSAIKAEFTRQEEYLSDLHVLHEKAKKIYQNVTKSNASDLVSFGKHFVDIAVNLNVNLPLRSLNRAKEHIEFIDFFKTVGNSMHVLANTVELTSIKQHFHDSMSWYSFLIELHDHLSKHSIQKNIKKFEPLVRKVTGDYTIARNKVINIKDTKLKAFLGGIEWKSPFILQNMQANAFKCRALRSVLNYTMSHVPTILCDSYILQIMGYNVKLSDVLEADCIEFAKSIEVLAINNLIIDVDLDQTGKQAQVSFISPRWEVIGKRNITVDGSSGLPYESAANDGTAKSIDGEHGKPGNPGNPSGSFLGIANEFIGSKQLTIQAIGGQGGTGQTGGAGIRSEPIRPYLQCNRLEECVPRWENEGTVKNCSTTYFPRLKHTCTLYGPLAKRANAGYGGIGGYGGSPGHVHIKSFKQTLQMSILSAHGKQGATGKAGQTGNVGIDLFRVAVVHFDNHEGIRIIQQSKAYQFITIPASVGANKEGIENPRKAKRIKPEVINSYKALARTFLANHIFRSHLESFVKDIEDCKAVQSHYGLFGFGDDLQKLDSQSLKLQMQLSFIPFYESLQQRIYAFAQAAATISTDEKHALRFMYATTMSRLASIKSNENGVSVLDLLGYLELIQTNIKKLQGTDKDINMIRYHEQYKHILTDKTDHALDLLNEEVIPEIERHFTEMRDQVPELIVDVKEDIAQNNEMRMKAMATKKKLEEAMIAHSVFSAFRLVGQVIRLFGGPMEVIGGAIEAGVTIGSTIYDDVNELEHLEERLERRKRNNRPSKLSQQLEIAGKTFNESRTVIEEEMSFFKLQLDDMGTMLSDNSDKKEQYVRPVLDKIKEHKQTLDKISRQEAIVAPKEIKKMRTELSKLVSEQRNQYNNDKKIVRNNKINKFFGKATDVVQIGGSGLDIYKTYKNDEKRIAQVSNYIKGIDDKIESLNDIVDWVSTEMIPLINDIYKDLKELSTDSGGQSDAKLEVNKWKIHIQLRSFKNKLSQELALTSSVPLFEQHIDQLEEALNVLINIYDRIASYKDKAVFANYFSQMITGKEPQIKDPLLNEGVQQLRAVILSNRILEQHANAIKAIKQHQFPFTELYLSASTFPDALELTNTKQILQHVEDQIEDLIRKIKTSRLSVGKYDRAIVGNVEFGSNLDPPFYIWKYADASNAIDRLLSGEEVMIKADIRRSLNVNAIKFNQLQLRVVAANVSQQQQLEREFIEADIMVSMIMVGNSYYRCGKKYYYISADDHIAIEYSMRKKVDGTPSRVNEVYRKIKESQYFLSPYATWKVTFQPNRLEKRGMSSIRIDRLELTGTGQYFGTGIYEKEICTDELDKFYTVEE